MTTSVENILSDILNFLKKIYRTFFAVFTKPYKELTTQCQDTNSNLVSPFLFLVLAITIFYSLTIGIINSTASGSIGLANSYLLGIKNYSLTERLIYSIPIWVSLLIFLKIISLFFKNEAKQNFICYTSYLVGSFLILFLATRFILLFIYLLGWEVLPFKPFYYSYQTTRQYTKPVFAVVKSLDVIFSISVFVTFFYKLVVFFKNQKKRINILLLFPIFSSLLILGVFRLTKIEISIIEKYFPQNNIQIATQLENDKEFIFHLITNGDTLHKLETTFFITNKSSDNIILEPKERFLLNFSSTSESNRTSLADSLTYLQYIFKSNDIKDSSTLIIKSGDTKILKFESTLDSSKMKWLLPYFKYDRIEQEFYFTINFKSTDRFFSQPYYRKQITIQK